MNELETLDVEKKKVRLEKIKSIFTDMGDQLKALQALYSPEKVNSIKESINEYNKNLGKSQQNGLAQFEEDNIQKLGSKEWTDFILAAKKYYDVIDGPVDKCIFCGQDIDGITVIDKYWDYLKLKAETEKERLMRALKSEKDIYDNTNVQLINRNSIVQEWLDENQTKLKQFEHIQKEIKESKEKISVSIADKKWDDGIKGINIDIKADELVRKIEEEIGSLEIEKVTTEQKKLKAELEYYDDCKKIIPLISQIDDFIKKCKYIKALSKKKISTRGITNKQGELFNKYVNQDYIKRFERECDQLNASFGVEIKNRNKNGSTLKKLVLKGNPPVDVLSDGEQRALSLADFFAETNSSKRNIAIVFDDPVSSLDHKRKKEIAKRIVDESLSRQVVVFTHDISFYFELLNTADSMNIEYERETIRKINDIPGVISPVVPWPAMTVKNRIKYLNGSLSNLEKIEKSNPERYYFECKQWCELLRESWERAVEEILLNDAIQRFNPAIQTKRLEKAKFSKELYYELEQGMSECSDWCHDQASALNGTIPSTKQLKEYIDTFQQYVKDNRA